MIDCDILIIGGGIAGLWLLNRLRQQGYQALLLECDALGAGQTGKSQGIIHGGLKYALQGIMGEDSQALRDIPGLWSDCLANTGEVDLRAVKVLSQHQLMWSSNLLTGGITTLFASNTLRSNVRELSKDAWPSALQHAQVGGKVYQIDELILDIASLSRALYDHVRDYCIKITACDFAYDANHQIAQVNANLAGQMITFRAQQYICTAGKGNAGLTVGLAPAPEMQLRPLHMVLLKGALPTLYGHCIGMGATPRLTISTHLTHDGTTIWYLGGKLAEDGVGLTAAAQISAARRELQAIFPRLNFDNMRFATFIIDRAEAKQANGHKPNDATMFVAANCVVAWPTKLALAPKLAHSILQHLQGQETIKSTSAVNVSNLPRPQVATPIWDILL